MKDTIDELLMLGAIKFSPWHFRINNFDLYVSEKKFKKGIPYKGFNRISEEWFDWRGIKQIKRMISDPIAISPEEIRTKTVQSIILSIF